MPFLDWIRWALQPWGKSSSLLSGTVSIGNPHFSTLLSPSRDSEGWWACMAASHQPWQVRSQGLWAGVSKTKEETFGRSQGEETSHNCSHLSLLWGCWQGSVGEHFSGREQRAWGTQQMKLRGQHATIFCIQVPCINAGGRGGPVITKKKRSLIWGFQGRLCRAAH